MDKDRELYHFMGGNTIVCFSFPTVLADHWLLDRSDEDEDLPEGTGLRKPPRGVKVTIDTREGLLLEALGHNADAAEG